MKHAWETVIAFKLVWFRVLCLFLLPAASTFLVLTETWSGTTWEETHTFLKVRMFISVAISGITVLVAFIDQSLGRTREQVQSNKKQASSGTETAV